MPTYALWNNKGGVGKSYLTFQIACEYARQHPEKRVLVLDVCPQANASGMLLGGMLRGEQALLTLGSANPRLTIAGYIRDRIASPYHNPGAGLRYLTSVHAYNSMVPTNVFVVAGDDELEVLASRVANATTPGPDDAWAKVHLWLADLIGDVRSAWGTDDITTFIDCNPSFGIYTELAMSASDRLIIPFSADGSSRRAVGAVLALLYGHVRTGGQQSEFFIKSQAARMTQPKIYCYVGNRLTQANYASANAFRTVVTEIGTAIWTAYTTSPSNFAVHPVGSPPPTTRAAFRQMFQLEVSDANTASVVSGALGIPIVSLTHGDYNLVARRVRVNQSQLDRQQPNIRTLVQSIE